MKVLLLCNFCGLFKQILGYLKTPGYATDLEVTHSLFYLFIFYTELGHVSVNSKDFFRDWDCRYRISTRDNLVSKLDNCLVTEFRMSAKSLLGSSVVLGESARRRVLGWGKGTVGLLHDYSVKALLYIFLERVQNLIAILRVLEMTMQICFVICQLFDVI